MNEESPQRPLAIVGKVVGLRPFWPEDFPIVFGWWSDMNDVPLWTSQYRQITTYPQFVTLLEGWIRESIPLIKIDLTTGKRFGFMRAYAMNLVDGYVWIQTYTAPEYRMRRHVAESAVLVSRYLFEQFPIRKICSEIFEFNEKARRLNEKLGFEYQGRLKEHTWYKDRYWDNLFYSLSREKWGEAMRRFGFIAAVEDDLTAMLNTDQAVAAAGR